MRAMPKFVVLEPADEVELKQVLRAGIAHEGPVYFRVARCPLPIIFGEDYRFEIGKSPVLREGKDVSLLGAGIMTSACLEAASLLEKEGLSAEVINVSTLKPLDEETLLRSAAKTRRVVTAENHSIIGGLGGAVAELLSCKLPTRLARVGIRDVFGRSGHLEDLLVEYHLTPQDVAAAARELMQSE